MPINLRNLSLTLVLAGIISSPVIAAQSGTGELLSSAKKWEQKNRPDRAKNFLLKLILIEPDSEEGLFMLGNIELQHGKPDQALRYLRSLEKVAPNSTRALELGKTYRMKVGDPNPGETSKPASAPPAAPPLASPPPPRTNLSKNSMSHAFATPPNPSSTKRMRNCRRCTRNPGIHGIACSNLNCKPTGANYCLMPCQATKRWLALPVSVPGASRKAGDVVYISCPTIPPNKMPLNTFWPPILTIRR